MKNKAMMLSTPLTKFPVYMSSIRIVTDDRQEAVKGLIHAEQTPPARYVVARDLFIEVLSGKMTYEQAYRQAGYEADPIKRRYALRIMEVSKDFFDNTRKYPISQLPTMAVILPNGMELNVAPIWARYDQPMRLMILYLWETPLSDLQLSVAAGLLHEAIRDTKYRGRELDFISVSRPTHSAGRRLQLMGWEKLKPFYDDDLKSALKFYLCDVWDEYHRRGPRPINLRRGRDLLNWRQ